jgi:hypothetical protein
LQNTTKASPTFPTKIHAGAVYMTTRDSLAARFAGRLLPVSDAIVRRWGIISGTVRRDTGHPPPVIDTLLAATALDHDLYLTTRNVRDVRHSGAAVFNPWEDDPSTFPVISRQRRRRPPQSRGLVGSLHDLCKTAR